MESKDAIEVTDLENAPHPGLGNHEAQLTVEKAYSLERADHDTEAERVDVGNAAQIQNEVMVPGSVLAEHVLTQLGRANDVEFAGDGENSPIAGGVWVHDEIHGSTVSDTRV